jgi:hypothetical protein
VIASFSKLHHFSTVVAPFPALLFAELQNSLCTFIVVALFAPVPLHVAFLADFSLAYFAFANFSSSHLVFVNVLWFDPYAASFLGTVESIFGRIFGKFSVPEYLEFDIEKFVNMVQRNLLFCAASWWHKLWIGCRKLKDTFEACVTHAMLAFQLRCLARRYIVEAGYAFHLNGRGRRWR